MTAPLAAPRIVIPFFSGNGHTRVLAEAIAKGAGNARPVDVQTMGTAEWRALDAAQAIVFGAPTYMGSTAAGFDRFLEAAADRWPELRWRDKIAGGFTVASYPSGDKLAALVRLAVFAAQMGMIWIGPAEIGAPVHPDRPGVNQWGSWLGLMATSSRDKSELIGADDRATARRYGARLAAAARRWQAG